MAARRSSTVTRAEVAGFLEANKLGSYAAAFEESGYDDLEDLKDMTEEDIKEVVEVTKMKPGHAIKFRKALASTNRNSSNSRGAAAAEEEASEQDPKQVLGALVENFDIVDVISNKQYTLLYKVVDKSYVQTPYVLKCFFKDDVPGKHDAKEFEREKGMLETINQRNPKVAVKLFDAKSHDETGSDFNVLVLEQGRMTAKEYLDEYFLPLPVDDRHAQQRPFVKKLVTLFADMHDAGIVHCDPKLENVCEQKRPSMFHP